MNLRVANSTLLEDHEVMEREPDLNRLQYAYELLQSDHSSAVTELEKLANGGSIMSALYLAHYYAVKPFTDEAKKEKWLKVAYQRGSARGLMHLAAHYEKNNNYDYAEQIYLNGVSQNDAPAMYYLAKLYQKTRRYNITSREIKRLLERAASLGHAKAMHDLWLLYIKGAFGIWRIPKGFFLLLLFLIRATRLSFGQQSDVYGQSDRRLW
jgi:TPR repeat protein